jgi:hypothetical protein
MQKIISLTTAEAEYYAASEMAIALRASNGVTTSSVAVSVPSTSTSESILRMKPSIIV